MNVFCRSQKYGCFDYNYQLNITWNRHSLSRLWLQRLSIKQQSELNIDTKHSSTACEFNPFRHSGYYSEQLIGLPGDRVMIIICAWKGFKRRRVIGVVKLVREDEHTPYYTISRSHLDPFVSVVTLSARSLTHTSSEPHSFVKGIWNTSKRSHASSTLSLKYCIISLSFVPLLSQGTKKYM